MKLSYSIIAVFVLLCACGSSDDTSGFSYPKSADVVQADPEFKHVYTGEESGISYYIKSVSEEAANVIADDDVASGFLIEGEEESFLYVAIKGEKIIMKPPLNDIVGLGYKLSLSEQE